MYFCGGVIECTVLVVYHLCIESTVQYSKVIFFYHCTLVFLKTRSFERHPFSFQHPNELRVAGPDQPVGLCPSLVLPFRP